jgi:hypothetical protein
MGIWRFYGLSGEEGLSKQKAMNEWTLGGHEVDAGRLISRATPGGGGGGVISAWSSLSAERN